jgi:hypothetical protein
METNPCKWCKVCDTPYVVGDDSTCEACLRERLPAVIWVSVIIFAALVGIVCAFR